MTEMHQCKRIHPHCQLRLTRDIWPDVNWHWGVTMPDGHLYDNSRGKMSFDQALADMQTRGVTALDAADIVWRNSHAPTAEPVAQGEAVSKALENAWFAVCDALSEIDPDWMMHGPEGVDAAVAKIRSLAAQPRAVPDGWKLVPPVASAAMESAFGAEYIQRNAKCDLIAFRDSYSAMLTAAPSPGESA